MQDSRCEFDRTDRTVALDALRGFALLGILVINIWLFGMPTIASFNPTLYPVHQFICSLELTPKPKIEPF